MKDLSNKKCFITGAASGIGRSTAVAAANQGMMLFLTDINRESLKETVDLIEENGGIVSAWESFDISRYEDVKKFADEIHEKFGAMDIVMNIAGIAIWGMVERLQHEHWEKSIKVNLMGPIHVMECFLPAMVREGNGGHLVNVSSTAGLVGLPWHAPYSASKFALRGISEVFRYDLMRHGIGVSVVCPGAVDTPLQQTVQIIGINGKSEKVEKLRKKFSDRAISPDAVAAMILDAVRRNRYLVITSPDIRKLYWFKRKAYFIYDIIMKKLNVMMNQLGQ